MLTRYVTQLRGHDITKETDLQLLSFLDRHIPTIQFVHGVANNRQPFWDFSAMKELVRSKRVISLVRDPRDTIVSYYHHKKSRDGAYDSTLSEFLRDSEYGFVRLLSYLNAQTTVVTENAAEAVTVHYEDMHTDPRSVMKAVSYFLHIEVQLELVDEAIAYTSFENVKKRERAGKLQNGRFGAGADGSENSYKARKGKIGSYQEEMTRDDIVWCNTLMDAMLPKELHFYLEDY